MSFPFIMTAQTADKTQGCIPLQVEYDGGAHSSYHWEFGDGASSQDANPSHIYITPGEYEAQLYTDASKTVLIGTIDISVYPDVQVSIDSDLDFSCTYNTIQFSSQVDLSSEVTITGYQWTFGDGARSQDCLLYTSPSPRDATLSRMPSSA